MSEIPEYIGFATMDDDGAITMILRAEGRGGAIGDAKLVYEPNSPDYNSVLEHLGGLNPGEEKPVRPWS